MSSLHLPPTSPLARMMQSAGPPATATRSSCDQAGGTVVDGASASGMASGASLVIKADQWHAPRCSCHCARWRVAVQTIRWRVAELRCSSTITHRWTVKVPYKELFACSAIVRQDRDGLEGS